MNSATSPVDHRALLHNVGHRMVRAVAKEVSDYAEALFAVVAERKPRGVGWPREEWEALLAELDASELTIAAFLEAEHRRPRP